MVVNVDIQNKDTKQRAIKLDFKETTGFGTVEQIIVFDISKDIILQINAKSQTYDIETTSHAGKGNTDIEDAAVPWIKLKDAITANFHSGSSLNNRGILAVKITTSGVLTDDFEVYAAQQTLEERAA